MNTHTPNNMEKQAQDAESNKNELNVSVSLLNSKMHFAGSANDFKPIHTDYIQPYGDNEAHMPLQVFLISLGSCAAGAVVVLLRKMNKQIDGLEVKVSGNRRTTHPTSFEQIHLDFHLTSDDTGDAAMEKALQLSEESICPIWAMIKGNVEVTYSYSITKKDEILVENL